MSSPSAPDTTRGLRFAMLFAANAPGCFCKPRQRFAKALTLLFWTHLSLERLALRASGPNAAKFRGPSAYPPPLTLHIGEGFRMFAGCRLFRRFITK